MRRMIDTMRETLAARSEMMSMFDALKEINQEGTTILLVEQNARMALQFAQRGYVLENGHLVVEGPSAELLENPEVKKAYLGG